MYLRKISKEIENVDERQIDIRGKCDQKLEEWVSMFKGYGKTCKLLFNNIIVKSMKGE